MGTVFTDNLALHTLGELGQSTASCCWVVIPTIRTQISPGCAQNLSIDQDVEIGLFVIVIDHEVSAEVVQSISTRGNCEGSSAGVIAKNMDVQVD